MPVLGLQALLPPKAFVTHFLFSLTRLFYLDLLLHFQLAIATMSCRSTIMWIGFLALLSTAESFAPLPAAKSPFTTALNLKMNQGSQLVAAWNAAHCHDDDDEEESNHPENTVKTIPKQSSARAFVSKVFKLPSTMIRRHPHPQEEGLEDVVYYPVVGFRFIQTDDNRSVALPTTNVNACCSLPPPEDQEPVYGWWTAACPLGSVYADDYCDAPRQDDQLAP